MTRDDEIAAFLARAGWPVAAPGWLDGDASTRRYARLSPPAILMDAPPEERDSNEAFHAVTHLLRGRGYSAPEILAADVPRGLMVLEDLGDALFARVLTGAAEQERSLYSAAVALLADLHRAPELSAPLHGYDTTAYAREVRLVTDWYVPALTGAAADPDAAQALVDGVLSAIAALPPRPAVVVLRDYHAENLIWLPERQGHQKVGLLDYQDALAGHPAYDLVSLIEDARRDTSLTLQAEMRVAYAAAAGLPLAEVETAVAVLGAQRNLKILGIFARLSQRDGKPRYLTLLPRVWSHLQRDLTHPALREVAQVAERLLPAPDAALLTPAGQSA